MKIESVSFASANTVRVKNVPPKPQNFGICCRTKTKILAPIADSFKRVAKAVPVEQKTVTPVGVKND